MKYFIFLSFISVQLFAAVTVDDRLLNVYAPDANGVMVNFGCIADAIKNSPANAAAIKAAAAAKVEALAVSHPAIAKAPLDAAKAAGCTIDSAKEKLINDKKTALDTKVLVELIDQMKVNIDKTALASASTLKY